MIVDEATDYSIEVWRRQFLGTKNPIYAWRAYQAARRLEKPIPEEILQYLDDVAFDIGEIAKRPPAPSERPRAISKALRLNKDGAGPGSEFRQFAEQRRRRQIAIETAKAIEDPRNGKQDSAFDEIASKHKIGRSTVRRIFIEYQERWKSEVDYLFEAGYVFRHEGTVLYKMNTVCNMEDYDEFEIVFKMAKERSAEE